jgi:hypothetical protein
LRLNIKLRSPRGEPASMSGLALAIDEEPTEAQRQQELRQQQERRKQLDLERARIQQEEKKIELARKRELEDLQLEAMRRDKQQRLETVGK